MIAVSAAAKARAVVAVVGQALQHQQRAEVGVAEAERAVVVRALRDLLGRVATRSRPGSPAPGRRRGSRGGSPRRRTRRPSPQELHQVDRREVAGRVVEEHVLGARVRRVDAVRSPCRCASCLDGVVVLHAGVGAAATPPRRSRATARARRSVS